MMDAVKLVNFNARKILFVMIVKMKNATIVLININLIFIKTDVSVINIVNNVI